MEIFQLEKRTYLKYHAPEMLNTEYLYQFKACADVIKEYGGTPGAQPGLSKLILSEMTGMDMSTYPSGITSDKSKAARKNSRE